MRCLVLVVASFGVMLSACGRAPSQYIDGFTPPEPQAGYTRFVTPIVHDVQPGQDITFCQWVKAPQDHDVLVTAFKTYQSNWGHHVVLFSDTANFPVGESHECLSTDMPSVRFIAGGAGEAATLFDFPPNVVTKIPAGSSVMANMHFINASSKPIDGQGVVDMLMVDASDPKAKDFQVAGTIANTGDMFDVPPNAQTGLDVSCVVKQKMNFFAYANHMHEWGASAYTEVIRASDQSKAMIREDKTWKPEYATHPPFSQWDIASLFTVDVGDTIHTHCEWHNTSSAPLTFPREMCVGFGLYLPSSPDIFCTNGVWEGN